MDLPDCGCLLCDPASDEPRWDARDARTAGHVRQHGWSAMGVAGGDSPGDWAYSIGLWHSLRSPEVSIFGRPPEQGMRIVNVLGRAIRGGRPIELGERRDDVLGGGYEVVVQPVHASWHLSFFGAGVDFQQRPPWPVAQLFWPDREGRFPWEEGVDEHCRAVQPLLWVPREESAGPWVETTG